MMTNKHYRALAIICTLFLYLTLVFVHSKYEELKKEAVERGYAEWVVDSDGETTWRWKEEDKK